MWRNIYGGTVASGFNFLAGYTGTATQLAIVYPQIDTFDSYRLGWLALTQELSVGDAGGNREVTVAEYPIWYPAYAISVLGLGQFTVYIDTNRNSQGYPHYVQLFVNEPS